MGSALDQAHETIYQACLTVPLVDAHAHNIVALDSNLPFLQCLSDERGHETLSGVPFSLAYQRSLQELGDMYGVEPNEAALKAHRESLGLEAVSEKCFGGANIECVLLDDGLTMDRMLGMGWHRKYVPSVHRVLRIETVAEAVLNQPVSQGGFATWTLESFDHRFVSTLESLSEKVVAFKSICAYRCGLRINPHVSAQAAETGLHENLKDHQAGQPVLVSNKAFIDFMFVRALEVATQRNIPMQIHTGFGDKDLQLELANPLHLRAILEDPLFAKSRIVLLHGSYPFMREASYLASVYSQVHIDFGLVVPMLSVRGMRCALSDLLDLAPVNKIMFSSDGYAFPETFYLGAKWSREMLTRVLCESYDNCDLTLEEALAAAELILNRNAIDFYKLEGNQAPPLQRALSTESLMRLQESLVPSVPAEKPPTFEFRVPAPVPRPAHPNGSSPAGMFHHDANPTPRFGKAQEPTVAKPQPGVVVAVTPVAPVVDMPRETVAVEAVEPVDVKPVEVTQVRLMYADTSGQLRCRVVPIRRFEEVVVVHGVGIAKCIMGMTSFTDSPAAESGLSAVGEIRLMPDLSTKVTLPWSPETAVVFTNMHEKPGVPWKYCPRNTLQRLSQTLRMGFNLVMRAGFDVGFYLLKQSPGSQKWEFLNTSPFSSAAGVHAASPILAEIYDVLASFNIHMEEMHCEGGGQFVVSLEEAHVLSAADNLLLVKETVSAIASKHSLRASFLPNLQTSSDIGSSRVRLTLWQEDTNALGSQDAEDEYGLSPFGQCFLGGIFHHLPAILAFTAPLPISYGSKSHSGYHFWGQGNLQAPLRTVFESTSPEVVSSLELRQFDGCSNPHLGLAAILASGIDGLRKHIHVPAPLDTSVEDLDPETVSHLPSVLDEAISALESNQVMRETMGAALVTAVLGVRKAEAMYYKDKIESKESLIARY